MKKIRILGIAPYKGMSDIMHAIAEQRDDIELRTVVADLDQGAAFVSGIEPDNYDAILTRGGTALSIKGITNIPVFDVMLSYYDAINAIKLAEAMQVKMGIVGYPSIAHIPNQLCSNLDINIDIFTTYSWDDTVRHIDHMIENGYELVLGDVSACRYAKSKSLASMLITSGSETIRASFDRIVEFAGYYLQHQMENKFMKNDLISRKESILVYELDRTLAFASVKKPSRFILSETQRMISDLELIGHKKNVKTQKGSYYHIAGEKRTISDKKYYIFHILMNKITNTFLTGSVAKSDNDGSESSFFSFLYHGKAFEEARTHIDEISASRYPVLIEGESGTGKDRLAEKIHAKSLLHNAPLFSINCQTFTSEELQRLIQDPSSPLHDNDFTFYFKNSDLLDKLLTEQLLAYIFATNMHKRHRLILSWRSDHTTEENKMNCSLLRNKLGCISLTVPNLQLCIDEIPKLSVMYINALNSLTTSQVLGLEPEAMSLLQGYQWPQNLDQLKRVLKEAVLLTKTPYITAETVQEILRKEKKSIGIAQDNPVMDLDLNQSLKDITYDIVLKVLKEENMNQSRTAKRLDISRTTLWRILKDDG